MCSRMKCLSHWRMWPQWKCCKLIPHVCVPCIRKQDFSWKSTVFRYGDCFGQFCRFPSQSSNQENVLYYNVLCHVLTGIGGGALSWWKYSCAYVVRYACTFHLTYISLTHNSVTVGNHTYVDMAFVAQNYYRNNLLKLWNVLYIKG
jgi:hypothetical protein